MVSTLEATTLTWDREHAQTHKTAQKHTSAIHRHTYIHTTKYTHSEAQGWRKRKVEAGSFYSLKSSLPHWSHLFHWGYISCSGLNLAAKWRVPLCSNTGVFTVSEGLNHHSYTLHVQLRHVSAICTRVTEDTFGFQPVFFFVFFAFLKVIITQSDTICYTLFISLWRASHTLFSALAQNVAISSGFFHWPFW